MHAAIFLANRQYPKTPLGCNELASAIKSPPQFLSKTLQKLVRAGLVSSVKGINGGFYLSDDNLKTRLLDIIECIDGEMAIRGCLLGKKLCNPAVPCLLHKDFLELRQEFTLFFAETILLDFHQNNLEVVKIPGLPR